MDQFWVCYTLYPEPCLMQTIGRIDYVVKRL